MFNNLIESSSHAREYKRRGTFLLFTGVTYILLFAITGVVSIYAYDAHLGNQTEEMVVDLMLPPPVTERQPTPAAVRPERPRNTNPNERDIDVRTDPMLSVNHPEKPPDFVSAKPNTNPPVPDGRPWTTGEHNYTADSIGGPVSTGNGTRVGGQPPTVVTLPDPPPAPPQPPKPPQVLKVSTILNSRALSLPKPNYPLMAKQIRVQGTVLVQVLIDEQGKVISAKAVSGHPLLIPESQKAAMLARFSPTMLGDQAVKVSGLITYNFVLGN